MGYRELTGQLVDLIEIHNLDQGVPDVQKLTSHLWNALHRLLPQRGMRYAKIDYLALHSDRKTADTATKQEFAVIDSRKLV